MGRWAFPIFSTNNQGRGLTTIPNLTESQQPFHVHLQVFHRPKGLVWIWAQVDDCNDMGPILLEAQ